MEKKRKTSCDIDKQPKLSGLLTEYLLDKLRSTVASTSMENKQASSEDLVNFASINSTFRFWNERCQVHVLHCSVVTQTICNAEKDCLHMSAAILTRPGIVEGACNKFLIYPTLQLISQSMGLKFT